MNTYRTSEVANIIGIHPNTVRLYEKLGLIPKPERRSNGYRKFTDFHIEQCKLVRLALQTEESMQGRVFGLLGAMYSGFLPVGMAVFGPLADQIPLQWVMIGSGVGLLLLTVFVAADRRMRLR